MLASLKNPDEALAYLRVSFQVDDPRVFLTTLRRVAQANGGFTELTARTGLNRENLYRTHSPTGNTKFVNIEAVLRSFGMKLTVERVS
ncbi:MAG: transcriptional regulator [Bacteroidetes bacterium]|nr:transcriptional regulator [Bacteroidota bacterium]